MQHLFEELKAIADLKSEIAKTEVILWQRLSRALASAAKASERKADPKPDVTIIQNARSSNYLTAAEAAKYLGISRTSLYKLRVNSQLRYVKIGEMPRYKVEDLDAMAKRPAMRD